MDNGNWGERAKGRGGEANLFSEKIPGDCGNMRFGGSPKLRISKPPDYPNEDVYVCGEKPLILSLCIIKPFVFTALAVA